MHYSTWSRASLVFAVTAVLTACGDGSSAKKTTPKSGRSQTCTADQTCGNGKAAIDGSTVDADIVPADCARITPGATVNIQNFTFTPQRVEIEEGDFVRWVNSDTVPHTVTSGKPGSANAGSAFDSGTLGVGQSVCYQFHTAADFTYFSSLDPEQMRDAVVAVRQSGDGKSADDPGDGVN